jgi:hypothetical protein
VSGRLRVGIAGERGLVFVPAFRALNDAEVSVFCYPHPQVRTVTSGARPPIDIFDALEETTGCFYWPLFIENGGVPDLRDPSPRSVLLDAPHPAAV